MNTILLIIPIPYAAWKIINRRGEWLYQSRIFNRPAWFILGGVLGNAVVPQCAKVIAEIALAFWDGVLT